MRGAFVACCLLVLLWLADAAEYTFQCVRQQANETCRWTDPERWYFSAPHSACAYAACLRRIPNGVPSNLDTAIVSLPSNDSTIVVDGLIEEATCAVLRS